MDPSRSTSLAAQSVGFQSLDGVTFEVTLSPDRSDVTVVVVGSIELGLLGVIVDQSEPLTVRATATAVPRLVP